MVDDDRRRLQRSKLLSKIGTVATAAAALLAEGTASAHDSEVLKGLLNRSDAIPSVSRDAEEPAKPLLPPLILKPGHADPAWMLAGHRSHSSHSSHRSHSSHSSHVSGSSHSSHFSSSGRIRSSGRSSTDYSGSSWTPSDSASSAPDPPTSRPDPPKPRPDPPKARAKAPRFKSQLAPEAEAAPKVEAAPEVKAAPAVDLRDPMLRYQLILIDTYGGVQKAYIKDHLVGSSSLLKVGETIGDCELMEILRPKQSVRLKPASGPEFTIKLNRSGPAKK